METYAEIMSNKRDVLGGNAEWFQKLKGYKLVRDPDRLRIGHYIRWISNGLLRNGGFLVEVGITDRGLYIKTKHLNRFVTVYMANCHVFQQISYDEAQVLAANS